MRFMLAYLVLIPLFAASSFAAVFTIIDSNAYLSDFNKPIQNVCPVTIKTSQNNPQLISTQGYWPATKACSALDMNTFATRTTSPPGLITLTDPATVQNGLKAELYAFGYRNGMVFGESRYYTKTLTPQEYNVWGSGTSIPIFSMEWCGEEWSGKFTTSTITPSSTKLTSDVDKADCTNSALQSQQAYFLTDTTKAFTLPLQQACQAYMIQVVGFTNDWPSTPGALAMTASGTTHSYSNSRKGNNGQLNTVRVTVQTDANQRASSIEVYSNDLSADNGGARITISCYKPIDPDTNMNLCKATQGANAWSPLVDTAAPGAACCGDDGDADLGWRGGSTCIKATTSGKTTYSWVTDATQCSQGNGQYLAGIGCCDKNTANTAYSTSIVCANMSTATTSSYAWQNASKENRAINITTAAASEWLMTDGSEWKSCLRTTNIPGYAAQQGTWRSATGISCTTSNTNAGASCQASWDCMNLCMNTGMYDCSHCDPALLCQGGTGGSTTVADATCTSGFYVCDSGKYWNGTHCQDKQCPAGFTVSGSKCVGSTGTPVAITAQSVCKSYTIGTGPTYTCVESGIWLDDSKKPFLYDASTPPKFITDPAQKNSAAQMCSQNTLVPIFKKYTPDFATFDFCASNECFAGTTNNPQCVASGEWSFAHRCEGSNGWVPRTQYLAESLYELREGDDFILHCDLPSETLNTHLIPDQFYTKKLINNVCVLSEPKGRKWEVVAAGVVLNTPSGKKEATVGEAILNPITATQRFTYALNSSDVNITNISCAQPLSANGFTKCATSSGALYYNSQYGILVFAKNDPGNPGTSWVGKLKALWSTAVGGRKNADNTGPIVPLAAQKIYLAHVGNREIQGVWQSTPAGAQIAVAYKNVNVNAVFPKNAPRTGASWFTTPTSEPILYFTDSGTNQAVWEAVTLAIRPQ